MRGLEQIPWVYDAVMWAAEHGRLRHWRAWLVGGAAGRILEIGCGTGRNLPLYRGASRIVAIDPHFDPLRKARRRAPGVPLVQARAEALPFQPGTFDTVVSSLVYCSVTDPPAALEETRRVLAPGGTLRMLEHVRSEHAWAARVQDLVQPTWTWLTGGCHPNRTTEETVRRAGFLVDEASRRARGLLRRFSASPPPTSR